MRIVIKQIAFILIVIIFSKTFLLATIGTDVSPIEAYVSINHSDKIGSGTLMDNGFTLTSDSLTCTYDSIYPVRGLINLNPTSRIYLNRDMNCDPFTYFGSGGQIYGNGYAINFPASAMNYFADSRATVSLNTSTITTQAMGAQVNSVSWSCDNLYVAGGANTSTGNLAVYPFSNNTLSAAAATNTVGANVNSVAWHPSSYYLAVGSAATNGLQVFQFTPPSTLSVTPANQKTLTGGAGIAVVWSPNGQYLAVADASDLYVYSFTNGSLGSSYIATAAITGTIDTNSISWDSSGTFIVLSSYRGGVAGTRGPYLAVYRFTGSALNVQVAAIRISATTADRVYSVSYLPNRLQFAACGTLTGLTPANQNILFYEQTGTTITQRYSFVDTTVFNTVTWSSDGSCLAVGGATGAGATLRIYLCPQNNFWYTSTDTYLILLTGITTASSVLQVDWANNNNNYLAVALGTNISVYIIGQLSTYRTTFALNKTNLTLNSDLDVISTVTFSGNCVIEGNGNKLILDTGANFKIASNSSLTLENIEIIGLNKTNIECLSNNASLILENCKLTLSSNFLFDNGSMQFNGDVMISGTNKFSYTSVMTSTINSESILYLDKNLTFSYAPAGAYRNLIYMPDSSAYLVLDGCTLHSSITGLQLMTGQIFVNNNVALQSEGVASSQAICFGNNNAKNNLTINVLSDAQLNIYGRLEYENTN